METNITLTRMTHPLSPTRTEFVQPTTGTPPPTPTPSKFVQPTSTPPPAPTPSEFVQHATGTQLPLHSFSVSATARQGQDRIYNLPGSVFVDVLGYLDNPSLEKLDKATDKVISAHLKQLKLTELDNSLRSRCYAFDDMIDRNYKEIGNTMFCCLIFTVCGWLGSLSVGSVSAINATQTLIGTETSGMCGLFAKRIHSLSTRNARNTHNALQMQLTKKIKIEHILKNILHTIDYLKLNNVDIDNPSEYLKFIIDEVNKLSTSRDKFKELIHIGLILFDYNNSLLQNRLNHVNNPSKLLNFISAVNDYLSMATAKEIANAQAVLDESADQDDIAGAKQVLERAESKKAVAIRQLMHLGLTLQEYEWQHGLFELIEKFNEISSSEIVNFIFKLIQNGNNKPIVNNNPFGKSVIEAISPFLDSWRMPNIHTEPWTQFKIDFESHLEIRSQHMERD